LALRLLGHIFGTGFGLGLAALLASLLSCYFAIILRQQIQQVCHKINIGFLPKTLGSFENSGAN